MGWEEMTTAEIMFGIGAFVAGMGAFLLIPGSVERGGLIRVRWFIPPFSILYALPFALERGGVLPRVSIVVSLVGMSIVGVGLTQCGHRAGPNGAVADAAGSPRDTELGFAVAPAREPATGSVARLPLAGPRPVAGAGAFELIADAQGSLLVWAEPLAAGGAMRALTLGARGDAVGVAVELGTSSDTVRELTAARAGERLAVAWISTDGRTARAHAAVSIGGAALSSRLELGTADVASAGGRLALAPLPDGTFLVVASITGPGGPVRVAQLGAPGRARSAALRVEAICERAIVGAIGTAEGAVVAVCERADAGATLLRARFLAGSLTPTLERATVLCPELTLTSIEGDITVLDRCGGAHATRDGHPREATDAVQIPRCEGDRPALGAALPLVAPTSRVDALFQPPVVPEGARAVWTGEALLVAARMGPELVMQRRQCEQGVLVRTDLP